jgi:hypothetical protein
MTTKKQNEANQKNALLSTGPTTVEGKEIVSLNATKHGIFTKDLIVSSGVGQENKEEYLEISKNLISCLSPQNQMESLLVEKIAIDFWRLRRVIRFETGSIGKYLEEIFENFYSPYSKKNNAEIDEEIESKKASIKWNICYLECLQKGVVTFDKPIWKDQNIDSDIIEDFYLITRNTYYGDLITSKEERERLSYGNLDFVEMKAVLKKIGYSSNKEITSRLIELYLKQNTDLKKEIQDLEQEKITNTATDFLNTKLGAIPKDENIDKVLKYERSLQKSIFQNLIMLKKLQGAC